MLRRWLLALVALLAFISVPAMSQNKDAPAKETPAKDKDATAKEKEAGAKDKDGSAKDKDAKAKDKDDKSTKPEVKPDPVKPSEGDAVLEWGFKENVPFYQKMTTTSEQTMSLGGNQVVQKQTQTFYFSWTPKKKDGDNWQIVQKIEGVEINIEIGSSKITYNSTKPDTTTNNPLADFFKQLIGSEFTLTLNKDLKVTKLEGREKFVEKLTGANPQMQPLLQQILSERAMMEMAEPTFAALPNKKVAKDDKWSRTTNLDIGPIGKYTNEYKYTYVGKDEKEKGMDKITVVTTLTYKDPGETGNAAALPFRIKSADLKTSNATGTIIYDPTKKLPVKTTMKLELQGDLVIDIGGQPTTVKLNQTQDSTVETSDKNLLPAPATTTPPK